MKSKLLTVLCAGFSCVAVNAGVIAGTNIENAAGDTLIADASNIPMSGGIAATGVFATGFDVVAAVASGDFLGLVSNFMSMTSSAIGQTQTEFGANIPGFYGNPSTDYGTPSADILGKTVYTFFGTGDTLATSSGYGLVEFPVTIDGDIPLPDSNNANLFTDGEWTVLIGTEGETASVDLSAIGAGTVVNPTFRLIPEPSTLLLSVFGVLGLLRRRR